MSSGPGVPLPREGRRILRRSWTVLVGPASARSRPFLTPIYYVWCGDEVFITTGPGSWTGRNVTANPHATLVFGGERGGPAAPRMRVTGPARCVDGWMPKVEPWSASRSGTTSRRGRSSTSCATFGRFPSGSGTTPRRAMGWATSSSGRPPWRCSTPDSSRGRGDEDAEPVSYTHLRAHETRHDLVCRLLL